MSKQPVPFLNIVVRYLLVSRVVSSNSAPRGALYVRPYILSANKGTPHFYKTTAPGVNCPLCPPLT